MRNLLLPALLSIAFATPSHALAPKVPAKPAPLVAGQLTFMLRTAGSPIDADRAGKGIYRELEADLDAGLADGPKALKDLRELDPALAGVLAATKSAMDDAIDPKHLGKEKFLASKDSAWAGPLVRYIGENDEEDEPYYSMVNHSLRSGKAVPAEYANYVHALREAMWHLPRFEGLSFRGTRLMQARLDQYYQVGKDASDPGLISTSVSPVSAMRFSEGVTDLQDPDHSNPDRKKTAVVILVRGQTGRPVSYFAGTDEREQEILFANGTPMKVKAKSAVFQDAEFGNVQLVLLEEAAPAKP